MTCTALPMASPGRFSPLGSGVFEIAVREVAMHFARDPGHSDADILHAKAVLAAKDYRRAG
jgi:hypothetical protein